MTPKIYRFAIGFFLMLTGVALAALSHAVEETVLFPKTFGGHQVDIYPSITVLLIGLVGSMTFVALKKKSKSRV